MVVWHGGCRDDWGEGERPEGHSDEKYPWPHPLLQEHWHSTRSASKVLPGANDNN